VNMVMVSWRAHPHSHPGIAEDLAWDLSNQAATENRTLSDFVDDMVYGAARPRCTWECTGCHKKSRTLLEHKVGWAFCGLQYCYLPWRMRMTFVRLLPPRRRACRVGRCTARHAHPVCTPCLARGWASHPPPRRYLG
jgi:hypothetical protein